MPDVKDDLEDVLVNFVRELSAALDDPRKTERVLNGDETVSSAEVGQRPETFTENNLIHPLLETCNLEFNEQPYGERGSQVVWPDFELLFDGPKVIGENKSLNNLQGGRSELQDYLDRKSIGADYGVLTDGFSWTLIKIELGGDVTEYPEIRSVNLRPVILELARREEVIGSASLGDIDIDERLREFGESFNHDQFVKLVTETAPKFIRDERKRDVDEFFELYIELLFGESDERNYQTSLLTDIESPSGASESDERLFAVTLVNRLLFIKFLESRDVLDDGFLRERVRVYQENREIFAGNLYDTQLKPIFYKLFNTREEERDPKFRGEHGAEWAKSVPYLNGGLFSENVDNEIEYTVNDRTLPTVVSDLIEGSELNLSSGGFDPALIGSVFEKTINYIEQDREQRDLGAYYTPNDVTDLINEEAVEPKAKDILIETFVPEVTDEQEERQIVRSNMEEMDLSEILRDIEEGRGWFGSPDAAETAIDRLSELKVVDPACGSGHFLTSAMDEILRIQMALLRGLNHGEDPSPRKRYELKRELALKSIYGVDVDEVATEIAKLRVWLKIIEQNSWNPDFGPLPNIDVNIATGNSLVGLPVKGLIQSASIWDEELAQLTEKRRAYKFDREGSKEEIENIVEGIRSDFDESYLERLTDPIETELDHIDTFEQIYNCIDASTLYPTVESVKIQRQDRESLDEAEKERFDRTGYATYKKSVRLDIQKRESYLKNQQKDNVKEIVADELRSILRDNFVFDEFVRQPLKYDLDRVLGDPFHWPIEFPEVTREGSGAERSINFDIVIGNPPYGDLLNGHEQMFVSKFETSSISEISAQFVERQAQLLAEEGYFGNVTTLRLVFQSNYGEFHDLLRNNFKPTRISCFGLRGRTGVFDNALIRVGIFTGQKVTGERGDIRTSDLILFTDENRTQRFDNIQVNSTDDLVLRNSIGGNGTRGPILPKIGPQIKRGLLETLRSASNRRIEDVFERDTPDTEDYPVILSESGGYWINPMLSPLTDKAGHRYLYFDTELEQKTAFLIYSSSLYYCYWITYGDQRHHTLTEMAGFPWPTGAIEEHDEEIRALADALWERMEDNFTGNSFQMSPLRPVIDDVDRLVGKLYGLSRDQIQYTMEYHTDIGEQSGRAGRKDASLVSQSSIDIS